MEKSAVIEEVAAFFSSLKFDKEIMTVNEEVYEMICESVLIFKINSQIFIVDKKAFASIGSLLDCHGRMLYNGWIGRAGARLTSSLRSCVYLTDSSVPASR